MRCVACNRALLEPAYRAPAGMGGWVLGPVCLQKQLGLPSYESLLDSDYRRKMLGRSKAGKIKPAKRGRAVAPLLRSAVLPGQLDLFAMAQ